jgi:hypothetical protein
LPIINERYAREAAAKNIYTLRYSSMHKEVSKDILKKHGSRKNKYHITKIKKNKGNLSIQKNLQQEMPF